MKNKEKFAKEIVEIACTGFEMAMDITTMKLTTCCGIDCDNCYFSSYNYPHNQGGCTENLVHWANAEYKEKKVFSEVDKAFVKGMNKLNWFVRDKSGDVYGFQNKPFKQDEIWCAHPSGKDLLQVEKVYRYFTSATFEPLSWEDDEPTHRSEILKEEKDE